MVKLNKKRHGIFPEGKKGISIMIGYVLLISIAIVLSIIVYQWVKTYIPNEAFQCSEGVSVFVSDYTYDCSTGDSLSITVKNNGRFSVNGFFIRASTKPDQEIATVDLTQYLDSGGTAGNGAIIIPGASDNNLNPGETVSSTFSVSSLDKIYFLEIIPLRQESINERTRSVTCSYARISQNLCP